MQKTTQKIIETESETKPILDSKISSEPTETLNFESVKEISREVTLKELNLYYFHLLNIPDQQRIKKTRLGRDQDMAKLKNQPVPDKSKYPSEFTINSVTPRKVGLWSSIYFKDAKRVVEMNGNYCEVFVGRTFIPGCQLAIIDLDLKGDLKYWPPSVPSFNNSILTAIESKIPFKNFAMETTSTGGLHLYFLVEDSFLFKLTKMVCAEKNSKFQEMFPNHQDIAGIELFGTKHKIYASPTKFADCPFQCKFRRIHTKPIQPIPAQSFIEFLNMLGFQVELVKVPDSEFNQILESFQQEKNPDSFIISSSQRESRLILKPKPLASTGQPLKVLTTIPNIAIQPELKKTSNLLLNHQKHETPKGLSEPLTLKIGKSKMRRLFQDLMLGLFQIYNIDDPFYQIFNGMYLHIEWTVWIELFYEWKLYAEGTPEEFASILRITQDEYKDEEMEAGLKQAIELFNKSSDKAKLPIGNLKYEKWVEQWHMRTNQALSDAYKLESQLLKVRPGFRAIWLGEKPMPVTNLGDSSGGILCKLNVFMKGFVRELRSAGFKDSEISAKFPVLTDVIQEVLLAKSSKRVSLRDYNNWFNENLKADVLEIERREQPERIHPEQAPQIFKLTWVPLYCNNGEAIHYDYWEALSHSEMESERRKSTEMKNQWECMFICGDRGLFYYKYRLNTLERDENESIQYEFHESHPIFGWKNFEMQSRVMIGTEPHFTFNLDGRVYPLKTELEIRDLLIDRCSQGSKNIKINKLLHCFIHKPDLLDLTSEYRKFYGFDENEIILPPKLVLPEGEVAEQTFNRFKDLIDKEKEFDLENQKKIFKDLFELTTIDHKDVSLAWIMASPLFYALRRYTRLIPPLFYISEEYENGKTAWMELLTTTLYGLTDKYTDANFKSGARYGAYMTTTTFPILIDDPEELPRQFLGEFKTFTSGSKTFNQKLGKGAGGQRFTVNKEWVTPICSTFNRSPAVLEQDAAFRSRCIVLPCGNTKKDPRWNLKMLELKQGFGTLIMKNFMQLSGMPAIIEKFKAIKLAEGNGTTGRENDLVCLLKLGAWISQEAFGITLKLSSIGIKANYKAGMMIPIRSVANIIYEAYLQNSLRIARDPTCNEIMATYSPTQTFPYPIFEKEDRDGEKIVLIDQLVLTSIQKLVDPKAFRSWTMENMAVELKQIYQSCEYRQCRYHCIPPERNLRCLESQLIERNKRFITIAKKELLQKNDVSEPKKLKNLTEKEFEQEFSKLQTETRSQTIPASVLSDVVKKAGFDPTSFNSVFEKLKEQERYTEILGEICRIDITKEKIA